MDKSTLPPELDFLSAHKFAEHIGPASTAYMALLVLPHDSIRASGQIQQAMAVLRDFIASHLRFTSEETQNIFETCAASIAARTNAVGDPTDDAAGRKAP